MDSTFFTVVAVIAISVQSYLLLLFFFEPSLRYKVWNPPTPSSREFLNMLQALLGVCTYPSSRVHVLANGNTFYASELDAIHAAQKSITLEAYIFQEGDLTRRFVAALAARARLGVKVNVVIDAVGSAGTSRSYFQELVDAGGRVARYHPFGWATVARFNNRTHRVLLVIDGCVGFVGGAGFADQWFNPMVQRHTWQPALARHDCSSGRQSSGEPASHLR